MNVGTDQVHNKFVEHPAIARITQCLVTLCEAGREERDEYCSEHKSGMHSTSGIQSIRNLVSFGDRIREEQSSLSEVGSNSTVDACHVLFLRAPYAPQGMAKRGKSGVFTVTCPVPDRA